MPRPVSGWLDCGFRLFGLTSAGLEAGERVGSRLIAFFAAITLAGCVQQAIRTEEPAARNCPRLAAGVRVAVVEALDRTYQGSGLPVAREFVAALEEASASVVPEVLARPGRILTPGWLAKQATAASASLFVTATVSSYALQAEQHRAYVVLTAVLFDSKGELLWSRRLAASASLALEAQGGDVTAGAVSLRRATNDAAKAFVRELLPDGTS